MTGRRRAYVVGIGSGNPDHLTREAVAALNAVDAFVVTHKDTAKEDLSTLRTELLETVVPDRRYRVVDVVDAARDARDGYVDGVARWHASRAERYAEAIRTGTAEDETVGFLVWGDPSLYDSTLRVLESVTEAGVPLDVIVVPGISSVSLLAAAHRIALNRVGLPVHITTGRRLLAEYDPALGDVVVMLDGGLTCAGLVERHPDLQIFWGAQLGLPDEALAAGPLADVLPTIREQRAAVRAARGWVMDTYLLRPGSL